MTWGGGEGVEDNGLKTTFGFCGVPPSAKTWRRSGEREDGEGEDAKREDAEGESVEDNGR